MRFIVTAAGCITAVFGMAWSGGHLSQLVAFFAGGGVGVVLSFVLLLALERLTLD